MYAATDGGFYSRVVGAAGGPWVAGNDSLITTAFNDIGLDYEDEPDDDPEPRQYADADTSMKVDPLNS